MSNETSIFRKFKTHGLSIQSDASRVLNDVLETQPDFDQALSDVIRDVRDRIERREILSSVISSSDIEAVVLDMTENEHDLKLTSTQVFDAFQNTPSLKFDEQYKTFKIQQNLSDNTKIKLHNDAFTKPKMFRERLKFIEQRLLRSNRFSLSSGVQGKNNKNNNENNNNNHNNHNSNTNNLIEISSIESLLGDSGTKLLLGYITQPKEGIWYLEDLGAMIPLNLSNATFLEDILYTQGSVVLVEGKLGTEGVFDAMVIAAPPVEEREFSLSRMGIIDPFGNNMRANQLEERRLIEEQSTESMFIVISDIHMDKPQVVEKLKTIFREFDTKCTNTNDNDDNFRDKQPLVFILIGSFLSQPFGVQNSHNLYDDAFKELGETISEFDNISKYAKFILVPGPTDPILSTSRPQRKLPERYQKLLKSFSKIKHITFVSNPFRLRYHTQELVFFRENLLRKMQRNTIISSQTKNDTDTNTNNTNSPSSSSSSNDDNNNNDNHVEGAQGNDIFKDLVKTILCQGHLLPLPLEARPIFWPLDHTLRLNPLPHLLILADHVDQFEHDVEGCKTANPGSLTTDGSFLIYYPSDQTMELSQV